MISPTAPARSARHLRSSVLVVAVVWLAGLAAACGGGDPSPDTMPGCGADLLFTGEIVDWDSIGDCGVADARVTVRSRPTETDDSAPNGRFEVCVPRQAQTVVDVVQSTDASRCAWVPGAYPVRGVFIAQQAVIEVNEQSFSARAMTQDRQTAMFGQMGASYMASQAQLVVRVAGTPRAVSISSNHGPTQTYTRVNNVDDWVAGDTGGYVFFPNVDPGATQLTVAGGAIGTGTFMLEAGAYTYVTVIAN